MMRSRLGAAAGVVGPLAFAGAWLIGSLKTSGYSMANDAISRLAAVGADTRALMTAGFISFTVCVLTFSFSLRAALPGGAWIAAASTAIATLGVAAFPLDHSATVDALHGLSATIGYVTLAATSLLASRQLKAQGDHRAAKVSALAGTATALCLAATILGPADGLFQRLGVSIGDLWIVAASVRMMRVADRPRTVPAAAERPR